MPAEHHEAGELGPGGVRDDQGVGAGVERRPRAEFAAPHADGPHVAQVLIQHVRHHAQDVRQVAVGDLVLEVDDDDRPEVRLTTSTLGPEQAQQGGMVVAVDHAARERVLDQLGEGLRRPLRLRKCVRSLAKVILYARRLPSLRLVSVSMGLGALAASKWSGSSCCPCSGSGTWQRKNLPCGLLARARRKRLSPSLAQVVQGEFFGRSGATGRAIAPGSAHRRSTAPTTSSFLVGMQPHEILGLRDAVMRQRGLQGPDIGHGGGVLGLELVEAEAGRLVDGRPFSVRSSDASDS